MMLRAEPARTHDLRGALDLLGRSELADQDVSQGWGHYFVVREDDGRVVGVPHRLPLVGCFHEAPGRLRTGGPGAPTRRTRRIP